MSDELRYKILRSGCEVPSHPGELSAHLARLILCGLADHAEDNGVLFVSSRTLARELKIGKSATFTAYKLFEDFGLLVRTNRRRGTGGATEYKLCLDSLTPTNPAYYLPTALSTRATSRSRSDLPSSPTSDLPSSPTSDLPTDPSTQARSRSISRSRSRSTNSEALFLQALKVELEFRPCYKLSFEQLADRKRSEYLPVCELVLAEFPAAQPSETPDRELALLVAGKLNPGLPALQLTEAGRRELDKRYRTQPESSPVCLTPEELRELTKTQPLKSNLPKRRPLLE
jgi:hypothetical protein